MCWSHVFFGSLAFHTDGFCASTAFITLSFVFVFFTATRETSFVHAISAAGVMHTLTKNCSMGDFDNCGCDDSRIGQTGIYIFFSTPQKQVITLVFFFLKIYACSVTVFLFNNLTKFNNFLFAGGKGWIWGGCSDNVAFGEKISKQFVDALEGGQDSRAAVNLHNNEAGRLVSHSTSISISILVAF